MPIASSSAAATIHVSTCAPVNAVVPDDPTAERTVTCVLTERWRPFDAVPDATIRCVPADALDGIVTLVENVPSGRADAEPSATGAEWKLSEIDDPACQCEPDTVTD